MEKFTSVMERFLVPLADKLSSNRYLSAISAGFAQLLPITMIGAIFTLLANLQIAPYQSFVTATGLKTILAFAPTVTTDMLAIYASYLIGKSCAERLGIEKDATIAGAVTLFVFLLMIPLGVSGVTQGGENLWIAGALSTRYLGSAGLFTAMILGCIVPTIYAFFIKKGITLKMPEQVPPTIAKSFAGLIPSFAIAFLFCAVRFGFAQTSFGDINNFVYTLLKTPLAQLGASPLTYIVFIIMCSLMWFFGLHGGMIVMPFLTMLYTTAGLENLAAYGEGAALPNIITMSNWALFTSLGGAGGTLGLCFLMAFVAKSKRYSTLGKIALPAGLCGINEPVTFGLPVVLNPVMLIPIVITPIITFSISYFFMATGIVPFTNGVAIPLGTPVIFSGLIAAGWQAALLQVGLIGLQVLIYFPFFRILEKQALNEEGK